MRPDRPRYARSPPQLIPRRITEPSMAVIIPVQLRSCGVGGGCGCRCEITAAGVGGPWQPREPAAAGVTGRSARWLGPSRPALHALSAGQAPAPAGPSLAHDIHTHSCARAPPHSHLPPAPGGGGAMDGHADIVTCMLCRSSANCRTERWRSDCGTASKMAAARINHLTASGSHHPSMMMLRAQSVDLAELRGA
jgi:hypothetical protein